MSRTEEDWEAEARREHYEKYETLAQKVGVDGLRAVLPATPEKIQAALEAGDKHLNTIPLIRWDRAAGCHQTLYDRECGRFPLTFYAGPWKHVKDKGLSLAERVCLLKHVAIHHVAGQPAPH